MESDGVKHTHAREDGAGVRKLQALGDVARKLPEAHKVVDRLHAAWKALVSKTTPRWKKVLVALEAARLAWESRGKPKADPEARE